ncbi:hypothetical protein PTW35_11385 [Photobacterium sp. DA100]|uniref:hypothetical protein n=1 Tax=Photobacterium sp. DA100 TaxID=3027472 RepID=UPI00247A40C7|nr:hypothetical protein [Photobacterium sp. DA100]WEM41236.1 hypothetical protein PTW35_11385 [Photobacterium sp. DA100]
MMKKTDVIYYLLVLITGLMVSGCGGGSSGATSTAAISHFQARQDIHAFDFVYGGSDYAVVDIIASGGENDEHGLSQGHLLYGTSERSQHLYQFDQRHEQNLTISLRDRNTRLILQDTQIALRSDTPYWVFAFGNTLTDRYSLYAVERPSTVRANNNVPLFVIDASSPNSRLRSDVYLNGHAIIEGLSSQTLSPPLSLPSDVASFSIELRSTDETSQRCIDIEPNHQDKEHQMQWNDSAWILVFTPDNHCYLQPVFWE